MMFMGRLKKKLRNARTSLRYDVIDEAFRRYPDGREVCLENAKGQAEYHRRTMEMHDRQSGICARGAHRIMAPTFDHSDCRGMGSSRRDDRIVDEAGLWMNGCSCWFCNGKAGSKRIVDKTSTEG